MAANMTDDLLNDDMDFMLSRVAENISFFLIEIENFRGEGRILMRHTYDIFFSEKILDFYKILEESEQFFILFLKKMENLRRFFSIFEVRSGNLNKKLHSGKSGARESKELKLKLVWPKHTNILFIFSFLFYRYSNMINFFYCKTDNFRCVR